MELTEQALVGAEFLAVDTETNGLGRDGCEVTEIGTVLVGGGELHDRWDSLVRTNLPLGRGIQRFTGITQSMIDEAPEAETVLPALAERLRGRVLVAHNAPFDLRVLRQAYNRIGLPWPDPPVICTASMARTLLPLQKERRLGALADALGVEVALAHRALADAETCARVLCVLFPRLCANAATVGEALELLKARRPRRRAASNARASGRGRRAQLGRSEGARSEDDAASPELDFATLPRDPGVYLFRDGAGQTLYVGKSVSIRSRARAHFAPSTPRAQWTAHATVVDYRPTRSELGALVLENRLIKELRPPGNVRLTRSDDRIVYIRCRLDIPFPILEVAPAPAAGHAVSIGPLRGRRLALELVEQLDSLFGLRHCGRTLPRRQHASAYGQMGRCLSPCLGDLDPNLYRRRLDEALSAFTEPGGDCAERLIAHVRNQMRVASGQRRYERAAWLHRRARRLRLILERLDGALHATHVQPRLVIARHPVGAGGDAFWLVAGRLLDWGPVPEDPAELATRSDEALRRGGHVSELGAHVPPPEVDEVRILGSYLLSHPELAQLPLQHGLSAKALGRFRRDALADQANGSATTSAPAAPIDTVAPTGASRRMSASANGPRRGDTAALETVPTTRPS